VAKKKRRGNPPPRGKQPTHKKTTKQTGGGGPPAKRWCPPNTTNTWPPPNPTLGPQNSFKHCVVCIFVGFFVFLVFFWLLFLFSNGTPPKKNHPKLKNPFFKQGDPTYCFLFFCLGVGTIVGAKKGGVFFLFFFLKSNTPSPKPKKKPKQLVFVWVQTPRQKPGKKPQFFGCNNPQILVLPGVPGSKKNKLSPALLKNPHKTNRPTKKKKRQKKKKIGGPPQKNHLLLDPKRKFLKQLGRTIVLGKKKKNPEENPNLAKKTVPKLVVPNGPHCVFLGKQA